MRSAALIVSLVALACSSAGYSQVDPTVEQGVHPFGSYDATKVDNVNLVNGGVNVNIPLFSYPERGSFGASVRLISSSKQWSVKVTCNIGTGTCSGVWQINPLAPGRGVYPNQTGMGIVIDDGVPYQGIAYTLHELPNGRYVQQGNLVAVEADGSTHPILGATSGSTVGSTVDGSGITVLAGSTRTMISRNGVVSSTKIEDPNGNIEQSSTGQDSMGRNGLYAAIRNAQTITDASGCGGPLPIVDVKLVTFPGPNGSTRQLKLCSVSMIGQTKFNATFYDTGNPGDQSQIAEGAIGQNVLQSAVLYNGSSWTSSPSWTFDYNNDVTGHLVTDGIENYLNLSKITFPTGGTISYGWSTQEIPSICGYSNESRFLVQRTASASDGSPNQVSSYNYYPGPATVKDSAGNVVQHYFTSLYTGCNTYETKTVYNDNAGHVLKTVQTAYTGEANPFYPETPSNTDINVLPSKITTTLPNGYVSQMQMDYDNGLAVTYYDPNWPTGNGDYGELLQVGYLSRGLVKQKREYAYGNGAPGALVRCTQYTYQALQNSQYLTANLLDLPAVIAVYSGACGTGTLISQTTNTYDAGTLQASGVTTQFDTAVPNPGIRGNLTSVQRWLNTGGSVTTSTKYYDTGMPYQSTDGNGHITTYSYSSANAGGLLTQTQLPTTGTVQHIISGAYDFNTGLLKSYTDQNSNSTSFTYDGLSRMLTATFPDSGVTTLSYPNFNTVAESALSGTTTTTDFDGLGRKSHFILTDSGGNDTTDYTYDSDGRLASVSNPYRSTSDPTYGITRYTYDALDRKTVQTQQDGSSTEKWAFNGTGTTGSTVVYTDEVGNQWQRTSDALGRLTKVLEPNSAETDYAYDLLDDLTRVDQWGGPNGSPGDRVRTFVYNSLRELTTSTNPEPGTTTYAYDANGNLTQRTRPLPNQSSATVYAKTVYSYDANNRLYLKTYTDNNVTSTTTPSVHIDYDLTTNASIQDTLSNKGKNLVGRKVDAYVKFGTGAIIAGEAFSYDKMGRVWDNPQCSPDNCTTGTYPVAYTYDVDGKILTSTSAYTFTYAYNAAAQITSVVSSWNDSQHPPTLMSGIQYSALGAITGASYGNGTAEALSYSSKRGWMTGDLVSGFTTGGTPTTLYSLAITNYATDGDIKAVTDSVNGTWAYTYDNLRRLQTATLNPSGSPSQLTWAYDGWGNQKSQTITEGTTPWPTDTFTYSANNQILQDGYDAAGNMINDGFHAYTYDDEGRIISVGNGGTATYVYNADGQRVHRVGSEGPEDYAYDLAGHAVTTILPSGGIVRREVYAGSLHVATYYSSTTFFDHADWQGTERVRSNVTGVSALTCTNLPYGDNQTCTGPLDPSPQHFTGKMRDPETGLDYFGARYYSSGTARWMLPDWSAVPEAVPYADMSNPQSLNLYTYVGNNPINGVDAGGHATGDHGQQCGQVGMQGVGTGGQSGGALGQVACSSPAPDLVSSNAAQLASDTIAGAVKGIANTVIDMSNAVNKPIDAALSNFTDFQFGQTSEFQASTPGQSGAMAGIFAVSLLTPEGDEAAVTKYQGLVADAEEKYPKLAGKFQDHHIIPKYLGGDEDGATARLPAAYHQMITNEFRGYAAYGKQVRPTADAVMDILKQVYTAFPLP